MKIEWSTRERTSPEYLFMKAVLLLDRSHTAQHVEQSYAEVTITVNGRDIAPDVLLSALLTSPQALAALQPVEGTQLLLPPVTCAPSNRPVTVIDGNVVMGTATFTALHAAARSMAMSKQRQVDDLLSQRRELLAQAATIQNRLPDGTREYAEALQAYEGLLTGLLR
jgi:hypothetical protein